MEEPATCPYPETLQSSPCSPSKFLRIHFNIILSSMPKSSKWSHSLRFPHHNPVCTFSLPHTCHMPSPSHSSWFHYLVNIGEKYSSIKLLIMQSSSQPFYFILLSTLFSNMLSVCSSLSMRDQVSYPYETTGKINSSVYLIFMFLEVVDWYSHANIYTEKKKHDHMLFTFLYVTVLLWYVHNTLHISSLIHGTTSYQSIAVFEHLYWCAV